ncbi:MAG: hypothetical protein AAF922_10880 [Pseudomonadota bacterium]
MSQISDMSGEEAERLLIFLANDTLAGEERAAVEAAVEADDRLAAELAALRTMRHKLQDEEASHSPGEFGLARLMRDIDAETTMAVTHVGGKRSGASSFWKIAAVVLLGLFSAQSAFVYLKGEQDGTDVQLASGDPAVSTERPTLRLDFDPDATVSEIASLLLETELTIVDGPSAIGFYTLEALDEAGYAQALEILQSRPDLVDIVE